MAQNSEGYEGDDIADDHTEGTVARTIENQTAKVPSDVFLWSALGAMGLSAISHFVGRRHTGLFFGQWAAPLLLFGVYNKLVKVAGNDMQTRSGGSKVDNSQKKASAVNEGKEDGRKFQDAQHSDKSLDSVHSNVSTGT